jgi:two-component system, NtrC family, response regulator PilR
MELLALVIDRDTSQRGVIKNILQNEGWDVREAATVEAALCLLDQVSGWRLVFCDAELSTQRVDPANNLTLLGELKGRGGETAQVIITAAAGRPIDALEAILNGAYEYLRKPLQEGEIIDCSRAVIERLRAAERDEGKEQGGSASELTAVTPEFVGESATITKVFRDLAKVVSDLRETVAHRRRNASTAAPQTSVFLTGETGTGKELIAQLIHQRSRPAGGIFVPVNCSNLSPELAESELFGHVQGAFTGALKEKEGLWELADGGTLFLDEITEAPPAVLSKLLRVLQDGLTKRLGSNRLRPTHVQVIAASNRDMQAEVNAGRFRSDLYYRLSLHKLHIPPLRERLADIPLIVEHLIRRHFTRRVRFSQEALDVLMTYDFPGNVRELENIVRGAARKSTDGVVYPVDLAAYVEMMEAGPAPHRGELQALTARAAANSSTANSAISDEGLDEQVHRFKLQVVRETLASCDGNITRAANALKISRPSLYRLIKELEAGDKLCRRRYAEQELNTELETNVQAHSAGAN